jgi:hypothetical protein
MAKIYQQNQWNKVKEHFREHPYYKFCKTVFDEFQKLCPTMVMTPEQLFVDASLTLDSIIQKGDKLAEQCRNLWTEKYNLYREQDLLSGGDKDDTQAEVAMLFYMVMYGVATVNHFHYRGTLQRTLHDCIHGFYGNENCTNIEQKLREPVNQHTDEMMDWMAEYFVSTQSLTKEIGLIFHPNKKDGTKESRKKKETIYYTLPYNCPDVNTRVRRVNIIMRKWQEWKWIEEPKIVDDFDHFFDGEPRNCNLKWIGKPTAILTELLKQILMQHYMNKVTGVTARSIVLNQFGQNPSGNKERIDAQGWERINLTKYILDYNKPLPLPQKGKGEGDDISDLALQAVFAKELHITKDLNRKYE